ncbi:unnamed protein product [Rotaria magnacalcarata]
MYGVISLCYTTSGRKASLFDGINIPSSKSKAKLITAVFVQTLVDDKSPTPKRLTLNEFSHEYEELSIKRNLNTSIHKYFIEQIYFAFTTNTKRIRETIHAVKFWAARPNIHCLTIFERKDLASASLMNSYLAGQGISCEIQTSNIIRFEERYLELIEQAWSSSISSSNASVKTIQWFAFGDDDTVWFLDNLLQTLQQYNASTSIYLGNISDKLGAIRHHGTYYAYGGGGIILSRPLALKAAQHMKDCRRFHHFFGGDEMIGKCITEILKINLTRNQNFHQMDHEGDMDGYFESGIQGLVSLHHMFSYWEPFPEEHTINPRETMDLLKLAYQTFNHDFLKRYVRIDQQTNRTFLLTMGYSFSVINRILTHDELMKVENTWWCCSQFVDQETRPKERNKTTWYFRGIASQTTTTMKRYGAVYENKRLKDRVAQFSTIEIILTNKLLRLV